MPGARLVFNDDLPGLQEMMPGIKDFVRAIAMDAPRLRMEQADRQAKAKDRTRQQSYEDEQRAVAPLLQMDPRAPSYKSAIATAPGRWKDTLESRMNAAEREDTDKYTQEFQQRYVQPTLAQHNAMESAKARQAATAARQTAKGNADKLYQTEHAKWASGRDELARKLSTEQIDDGGVKRTLRPNEIAERLQLYMMTSPEPQTSDVRFRVDGRSDLFGGLADAPDLTMDTGASSGQYAISKHPLGDVQKQVELGNLYAIGRRTGDMRLFNEAWSKLMMPADASPTEAPTEAAPAADVPGDLLQMQPAEGDPGAGEPVPYAGPPADVVAAHTAATGDETAQIQAHTTEAIAGAKQRLHALRGMIVEKAKRGDSAMDERAQAEAITQALAKLGVSADMLPPPLTMQFTADTRPQAMMSAALGPPSLHLPAP